MELQETLIRDMKIEFGLNNVIFTPRTFTQGDKNTHIISLIPDRSMDVRNKRMIVTFIRPYGNTSIVEQIEPSPQVDIIIPNEALTKVGRVYIEIVFVDNLTRDVITVLQRPYFEVVKTQHGSDDDAISGSTIQKTIFEQIQELNKFYKTKTEELIELLDKTIDEKVDKIIIDKIEENIEEIYNTIKDNMEKLTQSFVDKIEDSGNQKIQDLETAKQAHIQTMSSDASKLLKTLTDTSSGEINKIKSEGTKQVQAVTSQGNTSKRLVEQAGQNEITKINSTGTTIVSEGKKQIDTYIEANKESLKGDKGDIGPQGPKGEKGDKGEQGIQGPKGDMGLTGPAGTTDYNALTNKPDLSVYFLKGGTLDELYDTALKMQNKIKDLEARVIALEGAGA